MKPILNARVPAILALAMAGGLCAQGKHDPSEKNQIHLQKEVRHELVTLPFYNVFDNFEYRIDGSTVTLMGQVTRPNLKSDAEKAVKGIEGVERVVNNIEVLPVSPMDDQIRRAVYRAIYSDAVFSRETPEPSASIVIRVRGALEPQQIRAIRHLVASAVNGLKPQRVSIVDESGQLLADGAGGDTDNAIGDERRAAYEKRMRNEIEAIVSSVVGAGRARVQLTADFDYNKITQTSDKFDPEGRVLRSTQTREESSVTADNNGQVTVNNELPGNQNNNGAGTARDQSKKSEETNDYEISHTTKTEITEAGRVNRISVAVLVDGSYSKNEKGEMVYQERNKDQLDRIAALVRSAIGFDQKRGDQVEVVNLKFAEAPAVPPLAEPTGLFGALQFTKDDVMYVIELGVLMLLGLTVMFMVIRPLVKRILAAEVVPAVAPPGSLPALTDGSAGSADSPPGVAQLIDVAQVQGQVHAQSVHRVGELADRNPNETASIVRQWLSEPA